MFQSRYVSENNELPVKKPKESESIIKESRNRKNIISISKCKPDKTFKHDSIKLEHDLKKPVPDVKISDENLTPPVLEPIYPDIKVR